VTSSEEWGLNEEVAIVAGGIGNGQAAAILLARWSQSIGG
jgi:hypothetical protein